MFCILLAISSVRSAVVPPAPQVISQKVGWCVAMRSILSNKFSTPCNVSDKRVHTPPSNQYFHSVSDCHLLSPWREKLEREKGLAGLLRRVHFVDNLHFAKFSKAVTLRWAGREVDRGKLQNTSSHAARDVLERYPTERCKLVVLVGSEEAATVTTLLVLGASMWLTDCPRTVSVCTLCGFSHS